MAHGVAKTCERSAVSPCRHDADCSDASFFHQTGCDRGIAQWFAQANVTVPQVSLRPENLPLRIGEDCEQMNAKWYLPPQIDQAPVCDSRLRNDGEGQESELSEWTRQGASQVPGRRFDRRVSCRNLLQGSIGYQSRNR